MNEQDSGDWFGSIWVGRILYDQPDREFLLIEAQATRTVCMGIDGAEVDSPEIRSSKLADDNASWMAL